MPRKSDGKMLREVFTYRYHNNITCAIHFCKGFAVNLIVHFFELELAH